MKDKTLTDYLKTLREDIGRIASELDETEICIVPTTRDLFAITDKQFSSQVLPFRWYANVAYEKHIYPVADIDGKRITLQRFVFWLNSSEKSLKEIKQISFQNKCSFDCRISNLLDKDGRQNVMRNRKKKSNSASKYKGVKRVVRSNGGYSWRANIGLGEHVLYLGTVDNELDAAKLYDAAASVFFGTSALLNLPDQPIEDWASTRVHFQYQKMQAKIRSGG